MDPVSEAAGDKLCDVLSTEGELVTNWVAVVEVVDADGRRWLRTLTPETTTCWATMGMLDFALNDERAAALEAREQ